MCPAYSVIKLMQYLTYVAMLDVNRASRSTCQLIGHGHGQVATCLETSPKYHGACLLDVILSAALVATTSIEARRTRVCE